MSAVVVPGEDYPLVCEACLGPNPYVRMSKSVNGAECKISKRPFTAFRWKPGKQGYKSTVVSYTIAAQKNICQSCMTDLTYGLPVQLRDAFMRQAMESGVPGADLTSFSSMPLSRVGQDYQLNLQLARRGDEAAEDPTNVQHGATEALRMLAKGAAQHASSERPSFNRHLPRLCLFWVEGGCSKAREEQCPNRPCCGAFVLPELKGEDRKRVERDLVARGAVAVALDEDLRAKLRASAQQQQAAAAEGQAASGKRGKLVEDDSTTTLVVSGLPKHCTEEELLDAYSMFGPVVRANLTAGGRAFVELAKREDAGKAMAAEVVVREAKLVAAWAKKKVGGSNAQQQSNPPAAAAHPASAPPAAPAKPLLAPPGLQLGQDLPPPPPALLAALANRAKRVKM
jgi:pre-mRNA-splicing factor RBM22/SLT11